MTGKLKQQLIFGLLAWGLFASLPNTAHAQKWLGTVGSVSCECAEESHLHLEVKQGDSYLDPAACRN